MPVAEKEGAALVTRPRTAKDQAESTLAPPSDGGAADEEPTLSFAAPTVDAAARRLAINLAALRNHPSGSREFERLTAENRDLRRRAPGLDEWLGGIETHEWRARDADARELSATEAAASLGLTRPDGTPRDSFYALADELGGYRSAGKWRFPVSGIEDFKRRGGR